MSAPSPPRVLLARAVVQMSVNASARRCRAVRSPSGSGPGVNAARAARIWAPATGSNMPSMCTMPSKVREALSHRPWYRRTCRSAASSSSSRASLIWRIRRRSSAGGWSRAKSTSTFSTSSVRTCSPRSVAASTIAAACSTEIAPSASAAAVWTRSVQPGAGAHQQAGPAAVEVQPAAHPGGGGHEPVPGRGAHLVQVGHPAQHLRLGRAQCRP